MPKVEHSCADSEAAAESISRRTTLSRRRAIQLITSVAAVAISGRTAAFVSKAATLTVGLFTEASALSVPIGTEAVRTSGHVSNGLGSARYSYDAAVDSAYVTSHPYSSFVASNGRGFRLDETTPTSEMYGAIADGTTDHGARLLALIAEHRGRAVVIVPGTKARPLVTSRLHLDSRHGGTTVFFRSGVIRRVAGGDSLLYVAHAAKGMRFIGAGTLLDGTAPGRSSTVYLSGVEDCIIDGFEVAGSGNRKDCIYIGGEDATGGLPSRRVRITHNKVHGATRNNISVVEGHDIEIAHNEVYGTAPGVVGAGIDIEANRWDANGNPTISKIDIHDNVIRDNATFGVVAVFGDDIHIWRNTSYGNPSGDFATGEGGAEFNRGVSRKHKDRVAVVGFDMATGEVRVTPSAGANIEPGTLAVIAIRSGSGAAKPSEFDRATYWMIMSKSSDNSRLKLSLDARHSVDSLTNAGTGAFSADPFASDIYLLLFQTGACSNGIIEYNECPKDRPEVAAHSRILISTAVGWAVRNNRVYQTGAVAAIRAQYSRAIEISGNTVWADPARPAIAGIAATLCSELQSSGNIVRNMSHSGFSYNRVRNLREFGDRTLI